MRATVRALLPLLAVAGCASPSPSVVAIAPSATDALYWPRRVEPGRLEYAPDRSTFAPVLTERFPYPTQPEAEEAYRRLLAGALSEHGPVSVRLFGCKPGNLDAQTAWVIRYRGPVVHCATDFLDASGRSLGRQPVNYVYDGRAWTMQTVDPPRSLAPWIGQEKSPKDPWSWVPGRDRYE